MRVLIVLPQAKVTEKSCDEPDTRQAPAHLLQRSSSRLSARYPWQTFLRERTPERFQFYLSGRTDTNSIKSSPARRLRLHRIAQTYVTMFNAGAAIYRDEKPPVFVPGGSSPCRIESTAFYDSREMKELGLEMIKVHGSRMVGSLMTPSHTFAVFNGMDAVPTFDTQIEQRGKSCCKISAICGLAQVTRLMASCCPISGQ